MKRERCSREKTSFFQPELGGNIKVDFIKEVMLEMKCDLKIFEGFTRLIVIGNEMHFRHREELTT